MSKTENIATAFQRYVESEVWKCSSLPTGAHYLEAKSASGPDLKFVCNYCGTSRTIKSQPLEFRYGRDDNNSIPDLAGVRAISRDVDGEQEP